MAPSAESSSPTTMSPASIEAEAQAANRTSSTPARELRETKYPHALPEELRRNIARAINYEQSMVDQFARSRKGSTRSPVNTLPLSTQTIPSVNFVAASKSVHSSLRLVSHPSFAATSKSSESSLRLSQMQSLPPSPSRSNVTTDTTTNTSTALAIAKSPGTRPNHGLNTTQEDNASHRNSGTSAMKANPGPPWTPRKVLQANSRPQVHCHSSFASPITDTKVDPKHLHPMSPLPTGFTATPTTPAKNAQGKIIAPHSDSKYLQPQQQQQQQQQQLLTPNGQRTRRSSRGQKKKEALRVIARVRYDMELVPYVNINKALLWAVSPGLPHIPTLGAPSFEQPPFRQQPQADALADTRADALPTPPTTPRRITRSSAAATPAQAALRGYAGADADAMHLHLQTMPLVQTTARDIDGQLIDHHQQQQQQQHVNALALQLLGDESVVWEPAKRNEWDDCVSEMTSVCTSAVIRKFKGDKPFVPPLSQAYIRDRVDIDDPLEGYQVRHKAGGWLQGFVTWTNFTTWTHFFRWDSLHPASGVPRSASASFDGNVEKHQGASDLDGSLARMLDQQRRSGEPSHKGIVFESIAEIGLLGGLGCGELLLRMALASIAQHEQYRYVVLQATDGSKKFYERFGFRRVGAVCRYGKRDKGTEILPTIDSPIQGYRHWTHANESQKSLDLHGGPSYMMCLDLTMNLSDDESRRVWRQRQLDFLHITMSQGAAEKPTIGPLGQSGTSTPKKRPRARTSISTPTSASASPWSSKFLSPSKRRHPMSSTASLFPQAPKLTSTSASVSVSSRDSGSTVGKENEEVRPPSRKRRKLPSAVTATRTPSIHTVSIVAPTLPQPQPQPYPQTSSTPIAARTADTVSKTGSKRLPVLRGVRRSPRCLKQMSQLTPISSVQDASSEQQPKKRVATLRLRKTAKDTSATTSCNNSRSRKANAMPSSGVRADAPTAMSSPSKGHRKIDKRHFMKQKVKSYPRDRPHYYNKVVKAKNDKRGSSSARKSTRSSKAKYFFVVNYNEDEEALRLIPMEARGKLTGKRSGRPRYQCVVEDTDENFLHVKASDYEPVSAFMVMKTPLVAQEAWDILGR